MSEEVIEMLETERDQWRRQAIAAQEMLAQVLLVIGEPVVVPVGVSKKLNGKEIRLDLDTEAEEFTFQLVEKESSDTV